MLADAIGVSESSLKRWTDGGRLSAERTAGGHRRIAVAEAVRFVRESGLSVVKPELLGLSGLQPGQPRDPESRDDVADAFHEALIDDRFEAAGSLVVSLYLDGASLGWIFDVAIRRALSRIGELWRHEADGVFLEHRATETCLQSLAALRSLIPEPIDDAPIALGGGFEDDVYQVPSAMAAIVLAEAGFRARNLGAATPVAAMVAAARHYSPRLVWVSFSVSPSEPQVALSGLERIAREVGVGRVLVGGRGSSVLPSFRNPKIERLDSMAELSGYARAFASESAARVG